MEDVDLLLATNHLSHVNIFLLFHSKVKKNAVKSSELNLIRDESIAGRDALHSALKQEMESPQAALNRISSTNEEALQGDKKLQDQLDAVKRGEEEGRRAFLPSYTAGANTPQEVYSVTSIVPCAAEKELLRLLEDHHEACRRNVDNVWTWSWLGVENMPQVCMGLGWVDGHEMYY